MASKSINWRNSRLQSTRQIASIRETIQDIREIDDFEHHEDHAHSLLNRLKSKQRNSIIEASLSAHLQSEALKPYQAELIKLQIHLEKTDQKAILIVRWTRCSRQRGHHSPCYALHERETLSRARSGKAFESATHRASHETLHRTVPSRRGDGVIRSQLVQPRNDRTGHGILHQASVSSVYGPR
jgi:hypothetical protein